MPRLTCEAPRKGTQWPDPFVLGLAVHEPAGAYEAHGHAEIRFRIEGRPEREAQILLRVSAECVYRVRIDSVSSDWIDGRILQIYDLCGGARQKARYKAQDRALERKAWLEKLHSKYYDKPGASNE